MEHCGVEITICSSMATTTTSTTGITDGQVSSSSSAPVPELIKEIRQGLIEEDKEEENKQNKHHRRPYVYPECFQREECEQAVQQIEDFVKDTTLLQPNKDRLTAAPEDGWYNSHGAGFVLGDLKEILARRVFEPLYGGQRALHASKEGFALIRCFHTNIINTIDNDDSQSTTLHLPASIKEVAAAEEERPCIRSMTILQGNVNVTFHQHRHTPEDHLDNKGEQRCTSLLLRSGDVLIWRSDTTSLYVSAATAAAALTIENKEETLPPQPTTMIACCTMQPAAWTAHEVLSKKMEAYKERRTGDFRPHLETWVVGDSAASATFSNDTTSNNNSHSHRHSRQQQQYYRTGPPLVTIRQAELYGLLPYNTTATQPNEQTRLDRATIRGVRFKDTIAAARTSLSRSMTSPSSYDCSARLEFLTAANPATAAILEGADKWLGGMASPCGQYVYGVPGHAPKVLRITVNNNGSDNGDKTRNCTMDCIGPNYVGKFKWLRGVEVPSTPLHEDRYPNGCCLALPCNHASILKIDPASSKVYTFGEAVLQACGAKTWMYHGGNLASNGFVYAIPANAEYVLKFHPFTDHVELIGPRFPGKAKWYGGIVGSDGCIWGIPHNHSHVLHIDPTTDDVTLLGQGDEATGRQPLPEGMWKWHGGLRAGHKIIGFPNNSDSVLVIDCRNGQKRIYTIGDESILKSGRHRIPQDNRYKYLGGALTQDGSAAYLFPCDAEQVLRVDCANDKLSLVGPLLLEGENKFQNGFVGRDGALYGIPQRSCGVLRIVPRGCSEDGEDHVDIMDCGAGLIGCKDKFEGGVLGNDQNIYCIPLRAKSCVKIIP